MILTRIPELGSGEEIILEMASIGVKSIEFRLFLTNKRIILAEDRTKMGAPVEVPLQVLKNVNGGRNLSDEPTLSLSLSAPDGSDKKMVLVFIQDFSGSRDAECSYLQREIESLISVEKSSNQFAGKSYIPRSAEKGSSKIHGRTSPAASVSPGSMSLSAPNVVVKSREYTLKLEDKVFLLVDENKPNKPNKIPLDAVRSVEGLAGDNGEPDLIFMVEAQNGSMRRMVLSFSGWYEGGRFAERDAWVSVIQDYIATGEFGNPFNAGFSADGSFPSGSPGGGRDVQPVDSYQAVSGSSISGFDAKPPVPSVCPSCGGSIPPGGKFCSFCGREFNGGVSGSFPDPGNAVNPEISDGHGIYDAEEGDFIDDVPQKPVHGKRGRRPPAKKKVRRRRTPKKGVFSGGEKRPVRTDNSIPGRLISLLTNPAGGFQMTKGQDLVDAVPYFALVIVVFSFVNSLYLLLIGSGADASEYPVISSFGDAGGMIAGMLEMIVILVLVTLFAGIFLRLGLIIAGFKGSNEDEVRIAMYSATPFIAGGLIPFFGLIIAPLWSAYLLMVGARETHDTTTGQAVIAAGFCILMTGILFMLFVTAGDSGFALFGGA